MAPTPKKRKLVTTKPTKPTKPPQQSPAAAAAVEEKKKKPSPVIEPPKPRPEPVQEEEYEEEEVEYEEVEEEEEIEGDDEDGEGDGEESKGGDEEDDDDGEPIQKLLEPFSKDQLIGILTQAAETHRDVAVKIRKIADEDPVHRKIFVHGLGWDTTVETLRGAFSQYGEIEDCKAVTDKVSGKSKGYGFILFKSRSGANKALKEPQKKIGNRMTACQLAAVGPVAANSGAGAAAQVAAQQQQQQQPQSEYTQRKIFVSNVAADVDPAKLTGFFAKFGEIEEGPLGLDKVTGKPKGFCLFVYKTVESARRAMEEPHKNFEGHMLHVQRAIDGPKPGKQQQIQQRNAQFGRNDSLHLGGSPAVAGAPHLLAQQSVGALPFNQGAAVAAQAAFNPALGHALTALLATQGAGLGLGNLLGTLGTAGVGPVNPAVSGGYGNPVVGGTGLLGGYNGQAFQAAYPNQQSGQGSGARSQHGHMGGGTPYSGH